MTTDKTAVSLRPLMEFNPDVEVGSSVAKRWETWLKELNMYIVASGITDKSRKRALLLYTVGARVREIFSNLVDTGGDDDFDTAHAKLTEYFEPQKNTRYEVYNFRKMKQDVEESLDSFYMRLRSKATNCEFADKLEEEIEQQIIIGGSSSQIRKKALRDTAYKLKDMLLDGRRKEFSTFQSKEIESTLKSEKLERISEGRTFPRKKCFNCGGEYPHKKVCPAKGKRCDKCSRFNQFASCCRQRVQNVSNREGESENTSEASVAQSATVETVSGFSLREIPSSSNSSEDEYLFRVSNAKQPKAKIKMKGQHIKMTIDTGASINVIDEETYGKLGEVTLKKAVDCKAYTYNSDVPVKFRGKFKTVLESKHAIVPADVYVIQGKRAGCLLSSDTAQDLGLVTLHIDRISKKEKCGNVDSSIKETITKHKKVFNGVGKLRNYAVKLNIDETVTPLALKQRRVPFHIREKVDQALDKLIAEDIIEKVPDDQATPWVSPIVAVPQKDGSIRLCVDMRSPNKAIKRTRHPIPTVNDIDVLLNGAKYFSKLDVKQAFHQLELHEDSRYITTFITHRGLFRYKRLNFGTNAASEIFHYTLETCLAGIEGVANIHDDIILFAKTRAEHDRVLDNCLARLEELGLTLNEDKCKFLQPELSFFGHIYSENGVTPDPQRIRDIINLEAPSTLRDVRSFLGMLNYCAKFIEDFSTLTRPLRELLKENKFVWNENLQAKNDTDR